MSTATPEHLKGKRYDDQLQWIWKVNQAASSKREAKDTTQDIKCIILSRNCKKKKKKIEKPLWRDRDQQCIKSPN